VESNTRLIRRERWSDTLGGESEVIEAVVILDGSVGGGCFALTLLRLDFGGAIF
jgi:hypothetical protein